MRLLWMRRPRLDIALLHPREWPALCKARLRALQESPEAFASAYDREAQFTADDWLSTFEGSSWVVARTGEDIVGLARSLQNPGRPRVRNVESVWVDPAFRRHGITRALVETLAQVERPAGVREFLVWVLEDNHDARLVYAHLGFEPTGERQPLPSAAGRVEVRLRLDLAQLRSGH
jgi:GNAT superfamily N-acetyltransferase